MGKGESVCGGDGWWRALVEETFGSETLFSPYAAPAFFLAFTQSSMMMNRN